MSKRNSTHVTVSIPMELRKRMKEVPARVNWSAVAAEAFDRKITGLERTPPVRCSPMMWFVGGRPLSR